MFAREGVDPNRFPGPAEYMRSYSKACKFIKKLETLNPKLQFRIVEVSNHKTYSAIREVDWDDDEN